jgi:hypothetical protein
MSDSRRLKKALERIRDGAEGCECEHDTEDCCNNCDPVDYVCPYCIADVALKSLGERGASPPAPEITVSHGSPPGVGLGPDVEWPSKETQLCNQLELTEKADGLIYEWIMASNGPWRTDKITKAEDVEDLDYGATDLAWFASWFAARLVINGTFALVERGASPQAPPTTAETQIARHKAIEEAPEHKSHTILSHRVDTWKDAETGNYIALVCESMTQARTEQEAVESAKSLISTQAEWVARLQQPRW